MMDENFFNPYEVNEEKVVLSEVSSERNLTTTKTTAIIKVPKQYINETRYTIRSQDLIKARKILCQIREKNTLVDDVALSFSFLFIGVYLSWSISNKMFVNADNVSNLLQSFISPIFGVVLLVYILLKRRFLNIGTNKTIDDVLEILVDPVKEEENL